MKGRRKIKAGERVPVRFTARERTLVISHTFAGGEVTEPLEAARETRGACMVRYTLDDLDELLGHIAAEANHSKSKKLQKELDALHARLQAEMECYDDGQWQQPDRVFNEHQPSSPKGPAKLTVVKGKKGP